MDMLQLSTIVYKCSVSSVLNKDVKQHGKQFMFDLKEDTAWSSNEGTPQWILLQFEEPPQSLSGFEFQFQGGFVGKDAKIITETASGSVVSEEAFYPEDVNSVQRFHLKNPIKDGKIVKLKFVFNTSTDFFGRIIVYKLNLYQ